MGGPHGTSQTEGSLPLAPPQGNPGNEIPGIRIAFMNLGGGSPTFNTRKAQQLIYQLTLIRAVRTLISSGMNVIVLTELNEFWFEFIRDKIPCWRFIHDGRTVSIGYDKATCILKDSGKRKIYEDDTSQSGNTQLGWRTYFAAMFDVGESHPYHVVAAVHVVDGSHVSPTEDHRCPGGPLRCKFKEIISTDAMRAVLHPSIVAGLETSSTCVHIVGDWGIFDKNFQKAMESTKQELALKNSWRISSEFSHIWHRQDFGCTRSKEGMFLLKVLQ